MYRKLIQFVWDAHPADFRGEDIEAVEATIAALDQGKIRVAEKRAEVAFARQSAA